MSACPLLPSCSGVLAPGATATVGVGVYAYQSNARRCISNCDEVTAAASAAYLFLGGGTQAVNNDEDEEDSDDEDDDEDAGA